MLVFLMVLLQKLRLERGQFVERRRVRGRRGVRRLALR